MDLATREREYSPSSAIGGNYQPFIAAYIERSAAARASCPRWNSLAYGDAPRQVLDLFLPDLGTSPSPPPLLVFIHGGYWQELSKDESAFAAPGCLAHGAAFAALDYTLAPQASLPQIVAECQSAVCWLQQHADRLGFDARRIVLAGSSAGAHLAAMVAQGNPGVAATVLVSGVYTLEPLLGTSINKAVGLDLEQARRCSPALKDLHGFPPTVLAWGAIEPSVFAAQSRDFAARLRAAGARTECLEVPGRNHFDVVMDLTDPDTALGRLCLGQLTG